jgi:hypothetical protein
MKTFDRFEMRLDLCRREVLQLRDRLGSNRPLRERKDLLPFFRARPHLSAVCGVYNPTAFHCDRVAWEYDVFGDFGCDLAAGDSVTKSYTFIEFEDAGPNSLFVRHARKATREWSPRFLRGFAQLIDWFRKLDDMRKTDEFEARFGKRAIDFMGLLVVGRDQHTDAGERLRFEWWRENVLVHSRRVHCVTYDELVVNLLRHLESLSLPPSPEGASRARSPRGRRRRS